MARNDRIELIRQVEAHRGSRLICCVTSDRPNAQGVIAKDFIPLFFNNLVGMGEAPLGDVSKVDVFMFTLGGDTLAAFGLGRVIREFTKRVGCTHSRKMPERGNIVCVGGRRSFYGESCHTNPIDPSVNSPLGPVVEMMPGQRQSVPVSVESVAGYRNLLKEEWRLSSQAMGVAFRMLAEKINPWCWGTCTAAGSKSRSSRRHYCAVTAATSKTSIHC